MFIELALNRINEEIRDVINQKNSEKIRKVAEEFSLKNNLELDLAVHKIENYLVDIRLTFKNHRDISVLLRFSDDLIAGQLMKAFELNM